MKNLLLKNITKNFFNIILKSRFNIIIFFKLLKLLIFNQTYKFN